jgi:hypothetical protein
MLGQTWLDDRMTERLLAVQEAMNVRKADQQE